MTRVLLVSATVLTSAVLFGQAATVRIDGPHPLTVSAADLAAMPRTTVTASAHDHDATYEGVSIRELLTRVGVPAGEALRGRELAQAVVITGADGYRVAY